MPVYVKIFLGLCGLVIVLSVAGILYKNAQEGLNLLDAESVYGSECYSTYQSKVYYNKPFHGYYIVNGAKASTFTGLGGLSDNGTMGKDANYVYYKTERIPGVKPSEIIYLGNNFFKSGQTVYFGKIAIHNAIASSFKRLSGYYAADQNHLFYKDQLVSGADVTSVNLIALSTDQQNYPDDYLRDKNHVYFRGSVIPGAVPAHFTYLHVEDDQWRNSYAFDGQHYFYRQHEVLFHRAPDRTHLNLLTLDKGFTWYGMFYQGSAIYCYNADEDKLVLMGNRDNSAPIKTINRGVFSDGKHIYYSYCYWKWAHGRSFSGLLGYETGICVAEGADPANFKEVAKYGENSSNEGVIYQSGSQRYYHPAYNIDGRHHPGLSRFTADGKIEELPDGKALSKFFKYSDHSNFSFKAIADVFKPDSDYNDR